MCSGAIQRDPQTGVIGLRHGPTGEIAGIGESQSEFYERVGKKRQAEADALADQRNAVMAQQLASANQLQMQYAEQEAAQQEKVAGLKAVQADKIKGLQKEQAAKVKGIQMAGDTVANSLRAMGQSQLTAPTAAVTKKRTKNASPRQTSSSLTIGSTARSAGSGSNLSI